MDDREVTLAAALVEVRKAQLTLEGAAIMLRLEELEELSLAGPIDSILAAVDELAGVLEAARGEEPPAPKLHTIVGLGRRDPLGPALAICSCGWEAESAGAAYVGQKVVEHLGHQAAGQAASTWARRADLPFAGRWDV